MLHNLLHRSGISKRHCRTDPGSRRYMPCKCKSQLERHLMNMSIEYEDKFDINLGCQCVTNSDQTKAIALQVWSRVYYQFLIMKRGEEYCKKILVFPLTVRAISFMVLSMTSINLHVISLNEVHVLTDRLNTNRRTTSNRLSHRVLYRWNQLSWKWIAKMIVKKKYWWPNFVYKTIILVSYSLFVPRTLSLLLSLQHYNISTGATDHYCQCQYHEFIFPRQPV